MASLPVRQYDRTGKRVPHPAPGQLQTALRATAADGKSDDKDDTAADENVPSLRADPQTAPYPFYDLDARFGRCASARYYCLRGPAFVWAALRGLYWGLGFILLAAWQLLRCRCRCRPDATRDSESSTETETETECSGCVIDQPAEPLTDELFIQVATARHPFSSFLEKRPLAGAGDVWVLSTRPLENVRSIAAWDKVVPTVSCVIYFSLDKRAVLGAEVYRYVPAERRWALRAIRPAENGSEWEAAKVHCLQGLYFLIQFARHPMLHFAQESVLAALDTVWRDAAHPVRQLMAPHFEFTLEVNTAVLKGPASVLYGPDSCFCFDAVPMHREDLQRLFFVAGESTLRPDARIALPPNVAPYQFGLPPSLADAKPVYDAFRAFVGSVVQGRINASEDAQFVQLLRSRLSSSDWPAAISAADLLADFAFKASYQHSYEHHVVASLPLRAHPLPVGLSPYMGPDVYSGEVLATSAGYCKYACYSSCFEHWTRSCWYDTRLVAAPYAFTDPELLARAAAFRATLRELIPEELQDQLAKSIES